jgi:uncharacterized protein (TIGR02145 family)
MEHVIVQIVVMKISKMKNILSLILVLICNFLLSQEIHKKCVELNEKLVATESNLMMIEKKVDSLLTLNQSFSRSNDSLLNIINRINAENKLLTVGNQKWDSDNLKVIALNDGTPIFFADTREKWDSLFRIGEPAYCFHKNDTSGDYGYLYNYYAIESGKLAPEGLRIPTKIDVLELIDFLDKESVKGSMLLKSKDTTNSLFTNWKIKGVDKYGMNLRPYGFRLDDSKEWYFANKVYYWSQSLEQNKIEIMVITEINDDPFLLEKTIEEKNSNYGLYVRCIKQ